MYQYLDDICMCINILILVYLLYNLTLSVPKTIPTCGGPCHGSGG
jgi:hypothetical protein